MTYKELHSIWYRSVLDDGTVWCESRDFEEVMRMSKDKTVTIQEYRTYLVSDGWDTIGGHEVL